MGRLLIIEWSKHFAQVNLLAIKTFRRFEWQKPFHQLYTLSGVILDRVFGSAYCLLERKDKTIYCKIFSFLMHWAEQHGFPLTIVNEKGRLKTDLGLTSLDASVKGLVITGPKTLTWD